MKNCEINKHTTNEEWETTTRSSGQQSYIDGQQNRIDWENKWVSYDYAQD